MNIRDFSTFPATERDLTNSAQNALVLELADQMYKKYTDILELEDELFSDSKFVSNSSPVVLEALKCAASKRKLKDVQKPVHLSIVFAMYKETARLQPKSVNPHGEDCLREKVRQLRWLEKGLKAKFSWNIIAVDDGCPNKPSSYDVADSILKEEFFKNVEILKLESAINDLAICPGFTDLENTTHSRKGGAITYGLWKAQNTFVSTEKKHVISYTDADLSSNIAQSGNLISPIVNENKKAAIAHRYGISKSVLVKKDSITTEPESTKNQPGKLIILLRHLARTSLLPQIEHIKDTQAGFKAFDAQSIKETLLFMEFMNETFDVELLLRFINTHGKHSVKNIPILFTEDLAMSNFPANSLHDQHLNMFTQLVDIYEKISFKLHPIKDENLSFWKNLSFEDLQKIILHYNSPIYKEEIDKLLFDYEWSLKSLKSLCYSKVEKLK